MAEGLQNLSLKTKRLSGAQKMILQKQERMGAGTWVKRKPHKKTSGHKSDGKNTQTKGKKRTWSDNSTPQKSATKKAKEP